MPTKRLPIPGQDNGNWGQILNDYLKQISDPNKGGINIWSITNRPTGLGADNEGLTGINSDTGKIERWSGTQWVNFDSTKRAESIQNQRTGTGQVTSDDIKLIGTGTKFVEELQPGAVITSGGQSRIITKVISNTEAFINQPFYGTKATGPGTITTSGADISGNNLNQLKAGYLIVISNQTTQLISLNGSTGQMSRGLIGNYGSDKQSEWNLNVTNSAYEYIPNGYSTARAFTYTGIVAGFEGFDGKSKVVVGASGNLSVGEPVSNSGLEFNLESNPNVSGTVSTSWEKVIGAGTKFLSEVEIGDTIEVLLNTDTTPWFTSPGAKVTDAGVIYSTRRIVSINSDTEVIVDSPFNYQQNIPAGTQYKIYKSNNGLTIWDDSNSYSSQTSYSGIMSPIGISSEANIDIGNLASITKGRAPIVSLNSSADFLKSRWASKLVIINDTATDLGLQINKLLKKYAILTVYLKTNSEYTWNTFVDLSPEQYLYIRKNPEQSGSMPVIKMTKNATYTFDMQQYVGSLNGIYREVSRVLVRDYAYFNLESVKVVESANDTRPLSPRSDKAALFTAWGGSITFYGCEFESTEDIVTCNGQTNTSNLYEVWCKFQKAANSVRDIAITKYATGWNSAGQPLYVAWHAPELGPGVSWGTSSRIIYLRAQPTITPDGKFGIGTEAPTEKLHVVGNILATGTITPNSDERLKTNIKPITSALDKIASLKGVTYTWKNPENHGEDTSTQIGLLAQDVEKIFPEAVKTAADKDQTKSVNYNGLVGALVEAVKEQKSLLEKQDQVIEALQGRLDKAGL